VAVAAALVTGPIAGPIGTAAGLARTGAARAQPAPGEPSDGASPAERAGSDPARNRINLRIGSATTDRNGRPTLCADVRVVGRLAVEACGTGQALLHNEPGREMAHFRATWTLVQRATDRGTGKLRAGAGFAELQVGVDRPGFDFGSPDPDARGAVAGPEALVQGQWLVPLARGIEAVASLTAGAAAFAGAGELAEPQRTVQPFVSLELGLGW
jgi:hypothetical protein